MKAAALAFFLLLPSALPAAPRLEVLREGDVAHGCGCSFHVPPERRARGAMVLQWELGSEASIRLDGKLHRLSVKELTPAQSATGPEQLGQKAIFALQGTDVSARAECTVARVCKPEEASCEITEYRAALDIQAPTGARRVRAWAVCGC